jgi:hypothetical protein
MLLYRRQQPFDLFQARETGEFKAMWMRIGGARLGLSQVSQPSLHYYQR